MLRFVSFHLFLYMLSPKEIAFIKHWELVRHDYATFNSKLKRGLPMAILFTFPIFFSVVAVYFLSPEWYTKVGQKINGEFSTIMIALLICILFFSYFRMHFNWEMNEQLYQELKKKQSTLEK